MFTIKILIANKDPPCISTKDLIANYLVLGTHLGHNLAKIKTAQALNAELMRFLMSFVQLDCNYLRVTVAPTSSSLDLMSLASSSETPSLTFLGAPSTMSFESLRPRPVMSRTALITLTFS